MKQETSREKKAMSEGSADGQNRLQKENNAVNFEYYRIFYYVARYSSLTKAAEHLFSNQPNVSRVIKSLEQSLGCDLFIRFHKGVKLTPEGERLYAHVRIAMEHIQAAQNELQEMSALQAGAVSIAASEVALRCLLLPVLNAFRSRYPQIQIRISNHTTPQALSALENGFADLAVITSPCHPASQIEWVRLRDFQDCAVCSKKLARSIEQPLSISDLSQMPLIVLGSETATRQFYEEVFAQYNLHLNPDIEVAATDQILPVVRNHLGVGFVPQEFLSEEAQTGDLCTLSLVETIPPRSIYLARNRDVPRSQAARALEKMILDLRE